MLATGWKRFCFRWDGLQSGVLGEFASMAGHETFSLIYGSCRVFQNVQGNPTQTWPLLSIRVANLALTADANKLAVIGRTLAPSPASDANPSPSSRARLLEGSAGQSPPSAGASSSNLLEWRLAVFDVKSRQELW